MINYLKYFAYCYIVHYFGISAVMLFSSLYSFYIAQSKLNWNIFLFMLSNHFFGIYHAIMTLLVTMISDYKKMIMHIGTLTNEYHEFIAFYKEETKDGKNKSNGIELFLKSKDIVNGCYDKSGELWNVIGESKLSIVYDKMMLVDYEYYMGLINNYINVGVTKLDEYTDTIQKVKMSKDYVKRYLKYVIEYDFERVKKFIKPCDIESSEEQSDDCIKQPLNNLMPDLDKFMNSFDHSQQNVPNIDQLMESFKELQQLSLEAQNLQNNMPPLNRAQRKAMKRHHKKHSKKV